MKLKEYKKFIDKLVKEGHGNKEVYYSSDDEGNSYEPVYYAPSVQKASEMLNDESMEDFVVIN